VCHSAIAIRKKTAIKMWGFFNNVNREAQTCISCMILMRWTHALDLCVGLMRGTHALDSCVGLMRWTHALDSCVGIMRRTHALDSCVGLMRDI